MPARCSRRRPCVARPTTAPLDRRPRRRWHRAPARPNASGAAQDRPALRVRTPCPPVVCQRPRQSLRRYPSSTPLGVVPQKIGIGVRVDRPRRRPFARPCLHARRTRPPGATPPCRPKSKAPCAAAPPVADRGFHRSTSCCPRPPTAPISGTANRPQNQPRANPISTRGGFHACVWPTPG